VAAEGTGIGAEAPVEWTTGRRQRLARRLSGDDEAGALLVVPAREPAGRGDGAGGGAALAGWIGLDREWHRGVEFSMVVDAVARGRGVGGALLDEGLAWARRTGTPRITCHVWPHNTAALGLYLSRGMTVEGRLRRHWPRRNGERWDSVLLGLVLDVSVPGSPHPDSPLLTPDRPA
jgi:RimJ/RimL family protein N-acetyltransferase